MKKILFALAIMPLFIVGCSSDDIPSSSDFDYTLDYLYGEWRLVDVQSIGSPLDLTTPLNELYVPPTYLKFNKDGTLEGEGLFGEGTGRYSTKGEAIHTSIGKMKKSFDVTSLQTSTAKFKVDAKGIDTPLIPEDTKMVTVTLTKNYPRNDNFNYSIKSLYGKWRAVSLEGLPDGPVDLTSPYATPTYVTFEEKGVLLAEGYLGQGKGRYSTENKTIYTLINKQRLDLEVIALATGTARIKLNPAGLDFGIPIPANIETVTLELKKQ
ncbi:MAG: hypothetical protein GX921_07620 [Bacteroidales bacterium]|nr:hypothetical protein [Bacteroidales bacterium]